MAVKRAVAVDAIKLFILGFLFSMSALAQEAKSVKKLPPVELELLYGFYMQDGNHSAVTGGIGTEELSYNSPTILVHIPTDSLSQINVKAGVDVYSSASQDNIDFNVSSASAQDARTHLQLGYETNLPRKEIDFGIHGSFSVESDYLSLGLGGFFSKGFKNYSSVLTLSAQAYFDDCRWGWLDEDNELYLIYPAELRDTNWEEKYKRYTTTFSVSFTKMLTKRANIGFFIDGVWQSGLLSTTFHRIYFAQSQEEAIEKLPYLRLKLPVGLRFNYFFNRHFLLRTYYRFYADDWHIQSHTAEIEPVFKISSFMSVMPFYRFYQQSGAFWFQPYKMHQTTDRFYTSDYDLSAFTAHKFGIGFFWKPLGGLVNFNTTKNGYGWQGVQCRAGYYSRSDGLGAFFFSTALHFGAL